MNVQNTGSVLCFNMDADPLEKLDLVCRRLGIRLKVIQKEDFDRPVGALAGIALPTDPAFGMAPDSAGNMPDSDDSADAAGFETELMVMFNLNGSALDQFLRAMRREGVVVPYKCVLTPTNMNWKPAALCHELQREHEAMQKQRQNGDA